MWTLARRHGNKISLFFKHTFLTPVLANEDLFSFVKVPSHHLQKQHLAEASRNIPSSKILPGAEQL